MQVFLTMRFVVLLCSLYLVQCNALSLDELQNLMHQNCGLGSPTEDHKELIFSCKLPDEISEDSVQELFNAYAYVEMKDHVFDRTFFDREIELRHTFRVPTASIDMDTTELSFAIAREGFPIFTPPKGQPKNLPGL